MIIRKRNGSEAEFKKSNIMRFPRQMQKLEWMTDLQPPR